MKKINIYEEFQTEEDAIYALEYIIKQLRKGFTSGIDPTFDFDEVEEWKSVNYKIINLWGEIDGRWIY